MARTFTPSGGSAIDLPLMKEDENGSYSAALKIFGFPAVHGQQGLHMGRRSKPIKVSGRLPDADGGTTTKADIESLHEGTVGDLVIDGDTYSNCVVRSAKCHGFETVKSGTEKRTCLYTIELEQW